MFWRWSPETCREGTGQGSTYIWLTSNTLAFSRVQLWLSTWLRSEYCRGMENSANGTILAPRATCRSYSCVFFSDSVDDEAYRTLAGAAAALALLAS